MKRVTAPDMQAAKGQRKLAMLTAYDYATATLAEAAGADMLLVGDSLAMVVLGQDDTLSVTMDEMLHHTRAVARGAHRALVVGDMPFLSYQVSVPEAVTNAGRFLKEGHAGAIKLEGGREIAPQIRGMVAAGIPVMGHLGLTPQHVAAMGGFRIQSKTAEAAARLVEDARILAEAGCFALVLECIPQEVAQVVTEKISIPTIGIGAGPACDGQVLVFHDVLGLFDRFRPKFVKQYAELGKAAREALTRYVDEVKGASFPDQEHAFAMDAAALSRFRTLIAKDVSPKDAGKGDGAV